jgi:hypothetical protein
MAEAEKLEVLWILTLNELECASENTGSCANRIEIHLSDVFDKAVQAKIFQVRTLRLKRELLCMNMVRAKGKGKQSYKPLTVTVPQVYGRD